MVSPEEEHSEMILRGNLLAAASFLVFVMGVFTVPALSCKEYKYEAEGRCCPMCFPGWRVESHCTESSWTRCVPCTAGTFLDKPNGQKQCDTCRSCDPGMNVKQPCTAWSDTVCGAKEGYYCSNITGSGCAEAQKHRSCDPGQHISRRGTASTDSECSACSRGTFSDGTSTSCQPHRQCEEENLQLIAAGTPSSDAQCGGLTFRQTGAVIGSLLLLLLSSAALVVSVLYHKKKIHLKRYTQESRRSSDSGFSFRDEPPKISVVNPEGEAEKENLTVGAQCTDGEKEEKENVTQSLLKVDRTGQTTRKRSPRGSIDSGVSFRDGSQPMS